jgi:hypothetical protein
MEHLAVNPVSSSFVLCLLLGFSHDGNMPMNIARADKLAAAAVAAMGVEKEE